MANSANTRNFIVKNGIQCGNLFSNTTIFGFGTDVLISPTDVQVQNSTANAVMNRTSFALSNSSGNAAIVPLAVTINSANGTGSYGPSAISLGNTSSNVTLDGTQLVISNILSINASGLAISNLTANTFLANVANLNTLGVATILSAQTVTASNTLSVGANVIVSSISVFQGNSTVNSTLTSNSLQIIDGSGSVNVSTSSIKLGLLSFTPNQINVGSNVSLSTSTLSLGNSTVNSIYSATSIALSNSTSNVVITPAAISINGNQLLPQISDLGVIIGDGTNPITTGITPVYIGPFDYSFVISSWSLIGKESANLSLSVYKAAYSAFSGNTTSWTNITTGGTAPYYSSAYKNQGNTANWANTVIASGEIVYIPVVSAAGATQATLMLKTVKTS